MRGVIHLNHSFTSAKVLVINQHGVAVLTTEREPPTVINPYSPLPLERTSQGMQPPTRRIHVIPTLGSIQGPELQPKPGGMLGLDARFTSFEEVGLDTLVTE